MATWTNIADTFLEPGKPVRSVDGLALRDNPIAIAEGASGAPRIESDSAVNWGGGGTGTTSARNWVLNRMAAASSGAIGTYAFCRAGAQGGSASFSNPGTTQPGSNLNYSNATGTLNGASPSGTWRQMGYASRTGNATEEAPESTTLWLRIS